MKRTTLGLIGMSFLLGFSLTSGRAIAKKIKVSDKQLYGKRHDNGRHLGHVNRDSRSNSHDNGRHLGNRNERFVHGNRNDSRSRRVSSHYSYRNSTYYNRCSSNRHRDYTYGDRRSNHSPYYYRRCIPRQVKRPTVIRRVISCPRSTVKVESPRPNTNCGFDNSSTTKSRTSQGKVRTRNALLIAGAVNEIFNHSNNSKRDIRQGAIAATILNEIFHK